MVLSKKCNKKCYKSFIYFIELNIFNSFRPNQRFYSSFCLHLLFIMSIYTSGLGFLQPTCLCWKWHLLLQFRSCGVSRALLSCPRGSSVEMGERFHAPQAAELTDAASLGWAVCNEGGICFHFNGIVQFCIKTLIIYPHDKHLVSFINI